MKKTEELKKEIKQFESADGYPNKDEHLSFKKCLTTITGNSHTKIKVKNGINYLKIGKREFELLYVYCPESRNGFRHPFIMIKRKDTIVIFFLNSDTEIEGIHIGKEKEDGHECFKDIKFDIVDVIKVNKNLINIDDELIEK